MLVSYTPSILPSNKDGESGRERHGGMERGEEGGEK